MRAASRKLEFENGREIAAAALRPPTYPRHGFYLRLEVRIPFERNGREKTEKYRIEGYDISNISGTSAVGSMVVFENGKPNKDEYRKFRIRTVFKPNDVGMLTEVLERRFRGHRGVGAWAMPDLILIDGGLARSKCCEKSSHEGRFTHTHSRYRKGSGAQAQ